MKLFILGRHLNETEVQQFLTDFYATAYKIIESPKYRNMQIPDDIKENIAFAALRRALTTFDTDKGIPFEGYLKFLIENDMKSEFMKMKRRPLSVRDVPDESGERKDIFEFLETTKALSESDSVLYNTLITELDKQMTPRQKLLLDMLMNPQVHVEKYNQQFKPEKPLTKLNYEAIGKMLGISIASVTYELKKIQNLAAEILNKIEATKKNKLPKESEVIDTKCVRCGGEVDATEDDKGNITFKCKKCKDENKLTRN